MLNSSSTLAIMLRKPSLVCSRVESLGYIRQWQFSKRVLNIRQNKVGPAHQPRDVPGSVKELEE